MEKHITPLKAIRLKCLECSCGSAHEAKLCPAENCPLHPFRLGKNPNRAGIGNFGARFTNSPSDSAENLETEGMDIP